MSETEIIKETEKLHKVFNKYYELIDKFIFDRSNLKNGEFDYIKNVMDFIKKQMDLSDCIGRFLADLGAISK